MIYDIHQCRADERGALIEFLRKHWSANHIFTHCDELFDFQHKAGDGLYNFLIATNTITQEIDGVCGHIALSLYDRALNKHNEGWGAIWKVRDDVVNDEIGMLGLLINDRIMELYSSIGNIGISAVAKRFYRLKKMTLGTLAHYYIASEKVAEFKIASFGPTIPRGAKIESSAKLKEVTVNDLKAISHPYHPAKSPTYILNRYLNHPIYKYNLVGVFDSDNLCCALVTRVVEVNGGRCIRIVDIYGNVELMPNIYDQIQIYLQQQNAEYADCLNYGIEEEVFTRCGFSRLAIDGEIIIPNYFEPFVRQNIAIDFAYSAPSDYHYIIFKGDSDQDRPNIL